MVSRRVPAAVADDLEATDDLADSEETETFGGDDTASDELSPADIPSPLYYVGGLLGGLGCGLEEGAGVL